MTPVRRTIAARLGTTPRVGVVLVQHEANSFAHQPTTLDSFTILDGADADIRLAGANSEFAGACAEIRSLGGTAVPLLYAHALPSGPLEHDTYELLRASVVHAVVNAGAIDALVLCLHGAMSSSALAQGDLGILIAVRKHLGRDVPIAVTLDLHANATESLCNLAQVTTGYRTNPHVDLAETGRRAVRLLAAVMAGYLRPTTAVATCPAIFPDESLRIPGGILDDVIAAAWAEAGTAIVDISIFPTQPWLDAPGIGFTSVVLADDDPISARQLAKRIARQVWDRREQFGIDRLLSPNDALAAAEGADVRPFLITEAADAPTAGATGDGTAMLEALVQSPSDRTALITIVDPVTVAACHDVPVGTPVSLSVGAAIDPRWSEPVPIAGEVVRLGDGQYVLEGAGYTGMTATMGRFAVIAHRRLRVLVTELPAWSADPATWRHAGLDPYDVDVLCVRSCTDYRANFPAAAATAVVVDAPGAATPRLDRLRFRHAAVVPYPIDPRATY